jgi:hypothetical protein
MIRITIQKRATNSKARILRLDVARKILLTTAG